MSLSASHVTVLKIRTYMEGCMTMPLEYKHAVVRECFSRPLLCASEVFASYTSFLAVLFEQEFAALEAQDRDDNSIDISQRTPDEKNSIPFYVERMVQTARDLLTTWINREECQYSR